jgi:hypothetical protein
VTLRRLCPPAAVSLAVFASACGSTDHPSVRPADVARVKQTVHAALADLARGDGKGFCTLATRAGQAELARTLPGYGCAKLIDYVAAHLSAPARTGLLHSQVQRVTIDGSTAKVNSADITATQGSLTGFLDDGGKPTTLVRQPDGSWKING